MTCIGTGSALTYAPTSGLYQKTLVDNTSGYEGGCGLAVDGTWQCWGAGHNGSFLYYERALDLDLAVFNGSQPCIVRALDGQLSCWPSSSIGVGSRTGLPTGSFVKLALSYAGGCAIRKSDGQIACFGDNTSSKAVPPAAPVRFVAIDGGFHHYCALRADGRVDCWGRNDYGESNDPSGTDYVSVAVGTSHSCATHVTVEVKRAAVVALRTVSSAARTKRSAFRRALWMAICSPA